MEPLRSLKIDEVLFLPIFGRDNDYDTWPPEFEAYLDLETGEVVELGAEYGDEDEHDRARVAASPGRYLELPGLGHGEHHALLRQFLESEWTTDERLKRAASETYRGSIGKWKDRVEEATWRAFQGFRDRELQTQAEAMLRARGVAVEWC